MSASLIESIKKIRPSIIAVGFSPAPNQVTIIGSGFAVDANGKILSAAHLYSPLKPEQSEKLMGMVMTKQEKSGLEFYAWMPLKVLKKDDKDDVAILQIENYQQTLLKPLEIGDSDRIQVGQDTYFIGFPYAGELIQGGFGITLIANKGIISNIKPDGLSESHERNFIIVDAISNPGNSGCPLIDIDTNTVIGIMAIAFRTQSKKDPQLDIREPMHICAAKPINLAKKFL